MIRGVRSRCPRFLLLVALFLCSIPMVGCWTAHNEVFLPGEGETIPYTSSQTNLLHGGQLYLSRVSDSNDYRFRFEGNNDADCDKGTFRAMHIQGNVYVLQVQCADSNSYALEFYRITSDSYVAVSPDSAINMTARAARYDVNLSGDEISGRPPDINRFVRGLTDISFRGL
jgi:hypothetical protein